MTFKESVKTCVLKTFVWKGRASRSEYWWFWLFMGMVKFPIHWLSGVDFLGVTTGYDTLRAVAYFGHIPELEDLILPLDVIFFFPCLAVTVRRLHDMGLSAWWALLAMLPVVYIVFALVPGTPGENKYGPDSRGGKNTCPE